MIDARKYQQTSAPHGITVALTVDECGQAWWRAFMRDVQAHAYHMQPNHGADMAISRHVVGALGERAAAKALGLRWDQFVDGPDGIDFPPDIGIRTCLDGGRRSLICRSTDSDRYRFVAVILREDLTIPTFTLAGWAYGADAKQAKYKFGDNGRPPAYFMPIADLRPMADFRT